MADGLGDDLNRLIAKTLFGSYKKPTEVVEKIDEFIIDELENAKFVVIHCPVCRRYTVGVEWIEEHVDENGEEEEVYKYKCLGCNNEFTEGFVTEIYNPFTTVYLNTSFQELIRNSPNYKPYEGMDGFIREVRRFFEHLSDKLGVEIYRFIIASNVVFQYYRGFNYDGGYYLANSLKKIVWKKILELTVEFIPCCHLLEINDDHGLSVYIVIGKNDVDKILRYLRELGAVKYYLHWQ